MRGAAHLLEGVEMMTYKEIEARINELPRSRYRAKIVNDLDSVARKKGYERLWDFLLYTIRTELSRPKDSEIPESVDRDGLRKHFGLTNGQISGATSDGKLKCQKQGGKNIYPTSQEYLQRILRHRHDSLFR